MTTALTLINQAHRDLLAGTRENINVLATALTDTTTTSVVVTYDLEGIQAGSVIEIDTEQMYVLTSDATSKTATVIRGWEDSTAATHTAGTTVTVNPKFAKNAILTAMNDVLDDLSGEGMFQITAVELTYNSAINGYNLTGITDLDEVYAVTAREPGAAKRWPRIPRREWELRRNVETDDFASGFALFDSGGGFAGRQLRVECKVPFTRLSTTADDVQTVSGLPATANDLLKMGAAMRLVYWRETMRNVFESQGDSARARDVPAGANIGAARAWQAQYQNRLKNELERLARRYPDPAFA